MKWNFARKNGPKFPPHLRMGQVMSLTHTWRMRVRQTLVAHVAICLTSPINATCISRLFHSCMFFLYLSCLSPDDQVCVRQYHGRMHLVSHAITLVGWIMLHTARATVHTHSRSLLMPDHRPTARARKTEIIFENEIELHNEVQFQSLLSLSQSHDK